MQGFPTLTQERNKTLGFPRLGNSVRIVYGWAKQIRVVRDLAQVKCQKKPVHRSRLLGVQSICIIPRPNLHKFTYSPKGKTKNLDCLTWENWAASSGILQHSAALISGESQDPSGRRETVLYLPRKERAYRTLRPGALASPLPLYTNL